MAGAGHGSGVPETMESARRWSGFVCPDCRFVFRVPRDHDGQGVVCPSCRRMLRIPSSGDLPPPLVVPLRTPQVNDPATASDPRHRDKRRRKKKSHQSENHAWDSSSGHAPPSVRQEKRQMFWMLVGGGTMFVLIVAGVLVAMLGGEKPPTPPSNSETAKPAPPLPEATPPSKSQWNEAAFLAEAEPLTAKFLAATRIEDLLPLVRNPGIAEARMRIHYPEGTIDAPGMAEFNTETRTAHHGTLTTLKVRPHGRDDQILAFSETPEGIKIDWESWVGWSDMPWAKFLESKPATGQVFRLFLSPVDYYNFGFSDDRKWQSYRLESPDGAHSLFGYAERESALNARLRPTTDAKKSAMTLSLKFPESGTPRNQVIIGEIVADDWITETPAPP